MIDIRALLRRLFASALSKACNEELTNPQLIKLFVSHSTVDVCRSRGFSRYMLAPQVAGEGRAGS